MCEKNKFYCAFVAFYGHLHNSGEHIRCWHAQRGIQFEIYGNFSISTGMTISMLILAIYSSSFASSFPYRGSISTFCLLAYIVTSTFGFLTIPFTMLPELFPQRVRGVTAGLTVCVAYFFAFIAIKAYPSMLVVLGNEFIFLFYGIVSLLGTLFVRFILPETKGKTLQEIENLFKRQISNSADKA